MDNHHEYCELPLPVWAVSYDHPDNATICVSAESRSFEAIRHRRWRIFDFLWMLHTMDYNSRDDFGIMLLKGFSVP
ncbi:MAG: hypothetical protein IH947_05360 [Bacteroidetes bacterium]|nr:hypothetical protein [Bacteroidota bacterium]